MSIIRLIAAVLVSIGLVLSPVAVANAAAAFPATHADQAAGATKSHMHGDCGCCDVGDQCPAAMCGTSCAPLAPVFEAYQPAILGHAALSISAPLMLHGLGWSPSTPPPRA